VYESSFVNDESRNIKLKLMRLSFRFFIHSFNCFIAILCSCGMLKGSIGDCWNKLWMFCLILETEQGDVTFCLRQEVIFRPAFACLSVCLSVCPQDYSKTTAPILMKLCMWVPTLQKLICDSHKNVCDHYDNFVTIYLHNNICYCHKVILWI